MKNCKIPDCEQEHYARGFCEQHYNEVVENGESERLPVVPRGGENQNLSFKLNEALINKLYDETVRTMHKPLYKGINGPVLNQLLTLAINLAGCHSASRLFMAEMIDDLRGLAEAKNKVRFLETLENWQQKHTDFEGTSKNTTRENIFTLK
ncbi:hypothetical protein [Domibacillus robiginosus]|uniref:hypothetical protein n=1 Tax=Domibacillus robiginosus TaxID=1071054 RepID=UPI00067B7D0A|nr:hypothetical protein [Domibacillus robiginosus]